MTRRYNPETGEYAPLNINNQQNKPLLQRALNMDQIQDNLFKPGNSDQMQKKIDGLEQAHQTCFVCLDKPPNALYKPCGHAGICMECSYDNFKKNHQGKLA